MKNTELDKQKLKDTDNNIVVTRGKGRWREVENDKGVQILYGDLRRFDFGW